MGLPSKTMPQFTADQVAQWTSQLIAAGVLPPGTVLTLQSGDVLLATMQAFSSQLVFLQALAQLVNDLARAQTSEGADLDTFYAQFGFPRHAGVNATGPETFTKLTPATSAVTVPAGTIVQTVGGAIQYQTIADPSQPTWNAAQNAYVLAIGQTSLTATVQALQAGTAANVIAGQLSQLGQSLPGIDQVTNPSIISSGINQETDAAYSARFVSWLNSLSKATLGAITNAVQSVPGVVDENIVENVNPSGASQPGEFVVAIDDGTGSPPASLVATVQSAVNAVRGFTILGQVEAVVKESVTISLSVRVAAGYTATVVQTNAAAAVAAATNGTQIGATLFIVADVEAAALAVAGVVSCQPGQTKINGAAADWVPATPLQAARTTPTGVTVGTY